MEIEFAQYTKLRTLLNIRYLLSLSIFINLYLCFILQLKYVARFHTNNNNTFKNFIPKLSTMPYNFFILVLLQLPIKDSTTDISKKFDDPETYLLMTSFFSPTIHRNELRNSCACIAWCIHLVLYTNYIFDE